MLGLYALLALLSSPIAPNEAPKGSPEIREPLATEGGPSATADLTDQEVERLARESPEQLGSLTFGTNIEGRLAFGVPFPAGSAWEVVDPANSFGTAETVAAIVAAVEDVDARMPGPRMRINHLSRKSGGRLRSHFSHQAGRDVDLGFYRHAEGPNAGEMDLSRNWALVRALVTSADVEFILVGRRIQKRLYDFARSLGEDKAWLDSLFSGKDRLLLHAPNHNNHFHVRLYNPRAQELGRRALPFLGALRKDLAAAVHWPLPGETLAFVASRYGVSPAAIRTANGLWTDALPAGKPLVVPKPGACVQCLTPPPSAIPPRRLPPFNPPLFDSGKPHPTRPPQLAMALDRESANPARALGSRRSLDAPWEPQSDARPAGP